MPIVDKGEEAHGTVKETERTVVELVQQEEKKEGKEEELEDDIGRYEETGREEVKEMQLALTSKYDETG